MTQWIANCDTKRRVTDGGANSEYNLDKLTYYTGKGLKFSFQILIFLWFWLHFLLDIAIFPQTKLITSI